MGHQRAWWNDLAVGVAYFALAALSILTSRFDGGLAYLWLGNAMLITVLLRRPRRRWTGPIVASMIGSALATGLIGVGWAAAPVLAPANMLEALVAAYLLRRARSSLLPLGSVKWSMNLILAAGIAGPLAMASIAAPFMAYFYGQDLPTSALRVLGGHGLVNLTFIPILKLFATSRRFSLHAGQAVVQRRTLTLLFAIHLAVTLAVFTQQSLPLLFLPLLPLVAIVFRGDSRWSASAMLALALIASGGTLLGKGPIHLMAFDIGVEMQFAQFYLVATIFTTVPIAAQLRREVGLLAQVRSSEARYRMLADHSADIIMHSDRDGIVHFVSPSIEQVGGYRARELIGRSCLEIIHPDDHQKVVMHYQLALAGEHSDTRFEYRARRNDGSWCWFESDCRGLRNHDGASGVISIIRNIAERKAREEELAIAAMTDPLTGLLNRRAFREHANRVLADKRIRNATIALFDIDHFKSVNDRFGHDAGDEVLQSFAATAQLFLRENDVMARLGGEEFAILLPNTDQNGAMTVCERLRAEVAGSVCLTAAGVVRVTISGGVASLDQEGIDAALKRADMALYRAKAQGRDRLIPAAA